jgi:hypothetical protein
VAGHNRHRVTIELQGAEQRLRRFAAARHTTTAALVRQAVLTMLDGEPEIIDDDFENLTAAVDGAVVKTMIRLSAAHAEKLAVGARRALVSQSAYSTAGLAALCVDLNAIARLMRRGIVSDAEKHCANFTALADSVHQHVLMASQLIAGAKATWRARELDGGTKGRVGAGHDRIMHRRCPRAVGRAAVLPAYSKGQGGTAASSGRNDATSRGGYPGSHCRHRDASRAASDGQGDGWWAGHGCNCGAFSLYQQERPTRDRGRPTCHA